MIRALGVAMLLAAGAAEAANHQEKSRVTKTELKCGDRSLAACTKDRVAALQRLSTELKKTADLKPAVPTSDPKEVEALNAYNRWLLQQSDKAAALAKDGQAALLNTTKQMQDAQTSFNLQCLQLQSQMQRENQQFTSVSNVLKTRHDTAKNSISNVR